MSGRCNAAERRALVAELSTDLPQGWTITDAYRAETGAVSAAFSGPWWNGCLCGQCPQPIGQSVQTAEDVPSLREALRVSICAMSSPAGFA